MKSLSAALLLTFATLSLPLCATLARAQGSLTPPGPPGAVMKTLDQIESRTPIGTAPFTISQGGSYYLTANLTVATGHAITITADNVTLDLNGFTIKSTASPAQGAGIWLAGTAAATGNRGVSISNGTIAGAVTAAGSFFSGNGFSNGVAYLAGAFPVMVETTQLKVRGVSGTALSLGSQSAARDCSVRTAGGYGIQADAVVNCQAFECKNSGISGKNVDSSIGQCVGSSSPSDGISASVRAVHCEGIATGSGRGVLADTAIGCTGTAVGNHGVYCSEIARDCSGTSQSGVGLYAVMTSQCIGRSTSGTGLEADEANNCTGFSSSGTGLKAYNATQCYGGSGSTTINSGIYAVEVTGTATNCRGERPAGFIPVKANIAIGCTTSTANQKFLGTP